MAHPMSHTVAVPLWLLVVLIACTAWAALDLMLLPGARWMLRRRVERVVDQVRRRLSINLQPFKLTKREVLIDRLLYDPEVEAAAAANARDTDRPLELVMADVNRYAREIVPAFNAYFYFRIGYWLARRLAQLLYRVRLGSIDEDALAAIEPSATVVFVMNHRSNMDYVLVAYLAAARTALSYAVGEWARVWPLQRLVRSMGAYFVRRRSRNPLYRTVLARYVQMATAGGVTQAMYPEGGLSRDGRLGEPRLGLLDYLLRGFDPGGERDLVFVPVGLNYDRVLEDRTLLQGLDQRAAPPPAARAVFTTMRFVLHNLRLMVSNQWHRFGYACVSFGRPLSAREWLAGRGLDPRRLDREARFRRVAELASELMGAVGDVVPVVPTPLVAAVLLEDPGRTLTTLEIKAAALDRIERLLAAGACVYVPRQDREYAIEVGLRMLRLRHLVTEHDGLWAANPAELAVLRYYANSIAHLELAQPE